jgi:putative transposase
MIRAHKIRLHPTAEQPNYFDRAVGTARFCFNWGLAEWKRQYEAGEKPNARQLRAQFHAIRKEQFPWTYETTKCAVEGAFSDLGKAFKNFFEGHKKGRKVGYPHFKSKKKSRASFYLSNDKFTAGSHWIDIPKLGRVNMAECLRFRGKILGARVTKVAAWWFVSIQVELPDEHLVNTNPAVGVDVGVNRLVTLSDDGRFENQKPLRTALKKLAHAQRSLSRKKPGSKNREKAREKVARCHYEICSVRDDVLHKLTTIIAKTYGLVGIEDLHVKGLLRNHCLALSLSDAALGRLLTLLETKVLAAGGQVVKVGRYFPSSKRCSQCHTIHPDLELSDRVFACVNEECCYTADRDLNAALNLLQEALRL